MTARPEFPPNVVMYVKQEIDRRTQYKEQLEKIPVYIGYDDFTRRENQMERKALEDAIAGIYSGVLAIVKKHFLTIETDENQEVTISNILAALPAPESIRRITQVSARGQQ